MPSSHNPHPTSHSPLAVTASELQQLLSQVSFTRQSGFELQSFGDGECTIIAPFRKDFERPGGVIGGQVFMAAADVAMWLAIMTKLGAGDGPVTAEMKTNFLNGAREAECTNREGKRLTHHTITYMRP